MTEQAIYQPVPVEAAAKIAHDYSKDIVVILCWEWAAQMLHTTTYGKNLSDKGQASSLGDIVTKAAGGDISRAVTYQDYRQPDEAAKNALIAREAVALLRRLYDSGAFNRHDEITVSQWLRENAPDIAAG